MRFREGEALAEAGVPAPRDLPHQLQVLELVLPHRHERRLVQEHVGGLEHGVIEQAGGNALLALRLVLELGLALELPERCDRGEEPVELGVLGDVRLHEHHRAFGVEARGEEPDRHVERALSQRGGIVGLGDRVQVHD